MKYTRNIRIFTVISFLQGLVFYAPVAALYREMAGVSLSSMLIIESVYWATIILMEIPWGIFAARYGYTRTIRLSLGFLLVSKIIFVLAGSFPHFLIERMVLAVAYAGLSGCDSAYLFESRGSSPAASIYLLVGRASILGLLVASPLGSYVAAYNMRLTAWLTVGSHCILFLVSFLLTEPESGTAGSTVAPEHKSLSIRRFARFAPTGRMLLLLVSTACIMEATNVTGAFLSQLQYRAVGLDTRYFGLVHGGIQVSALIGLSVVSWKWQKNPGRIIWLTPLICGLLILLLRSTVSIVLSILMVASAVLTGHIFSSFGLMLQNEWIRTGKRSIELSVNAVYVEAFSIGIQMMLSLIARRQLTDTYGLVGIFLLLGAFLVYCAQHVSRQQQRS